MTKTATATDIHAILAVLQDREAAKSQINPDDNPFVHHDLKQLSHGLLKGADNIPAVNMAAKAPTELSYALEEGRFTVAQEGKADKSARRMAEARRRAERKVAYDRIVKSKKVPSQARMTEAWLVVVNLVTIIDKITRNKQRWATRYLGSNADDIPSMAREQIALVVAKQSQWPMPLLGEAAEQLGRIESGIPGAQVWNDDDPKHIKEVKKARKWLMGMVYNRIMGALVDSYTDAHNLRWENLDLLTTVMASIGGVADDPLGAYFKVEQSPLLMGAKFQRPGGINPDLLATAVSAAITEQGLDGLAEFLLDDDHRRTDGAVMWSKHAEAIFKLTPGGYGDWMWDQVIASTQHLARAENVRGEAAMNHCRNLFRSLPWLIVAVVRAFDPYTLGYNHANGRRAVLASEFELFYAPEDSPKREMLAPVLRYADTDEAVQALLEHLGQLVTGNDLLASAVNA